MGQKRTKFVWIELLIKMFIAVICSALARKIFTLDLRKEMQIVSLKK